jgi:hypothetical protein
MICRQLRCTQPPLLASHQADMLGVPGRALVRICARIDQQPPVCLRHVIQHPDRP